MITKWETQKERIKRFMKIPVRKKLEWLRQMQEFAQKTSSKSMLRFRQELRVRRV